MAEQRTTQVTEEVVVKASQAQAKITQYAVETLGRGASQARITQASVEIVVIVTSGGPPARVRRWVTFI